MTSHPKNRYFLTSPIALVVFVFFALQAVPSLAQTNVQSDAQIGEVLGEALSLVKQNNFSRAKSLQRKLNDPEARALIQWSLLRAEHGDWRDYTAFLRDHADWPGLKYLRRQGEAAIKESTPRREVLDYFADQPPQTGNGAYYFARALRRSNKRAEADRQIIRAWREFVLSRDEETKILKDFGATLKNYHTERVDELLWRGGGAARSAAERMLARIGKGEATLARARIALQRSTAGVDSFLDAVPQELKDDEGLAYDRFMWRIRRSRWDDAEAFLVEKTREGVTKRGEKWASRRRGFARRAMRAGNHETAYLLAANHGLNSGSNMADLEWLAGYLSLRFLNEYERALEHFTAAEALVASPISVARMGYWRGRALEELGRNAPAKAAYETAATHQTAFYGQLAAQKLDKPQILRDKSLAGQQKIKDWRTAKALKTKVIRVGTLAHYADELHLVRTFFSHAAETMTRDDQAALADYAVEIGRPFVAIKLAKQVAREGEVLMAAYFPLIDLGKISLPVKTELTLSIARRESEFDPKARSHANALGLMQVLPSTAKSVVRRLNLSYSVQKLGSDWRYNAAIGSAYLAEVIARFNGSYVLGFAAYNAGPGRVNQWLEAYGNPHKRGDTKIGRHTDIIDWIEHIPFRETRNYVMRVAESLHVYRARIEGKTPKLSLWRDLNRGDF